MKNLFISNTFFLWLIHHVSGNFGVINNQFGFEGRGNLKGAEMNVENSTLDKYLNFRKLTLIDGKEADKKITIKETAHEKCSVQNCPKVRGSCSKALFCECKPEYISINDDNYPFFCNYELKLQATAFYLEFFLGFGIGHLYIGNVQIAMYKLIAYFTAYFILCFIPYFSGQAKISFLQKCLPFLHTISILMIIIWQVIDTYLLGTNYFPDSNGIPLKKW